MNYNVEVFKNQFPVVKQFVYHLVCSRVVSSACRALELESVFWRSTGEAHLLLASIQWCMVFGSHGLTNPTHWKRLAEVESKELEESFRQGLLQQIGITATKFEKYWNEMKYFRDNYAAHRKLGEYKKPVPDFTVALNTVFYYDEWIRKIIYQDIFEEPLLKQSYEVMKQTSTPLIYQLIEYTKNQCKENIVI